MLKAIYPGSFDPVTRGHYDIICRSCKIVDKLIVGVLNNKAKMPLFSVEERVKMLKEVTKDLPNVEIIPFDGLLVDFAEQIGADVVIQWVQKSLPTFFFKEKFLLKKLLTCSPSVIMQVHLSLLLFLF